VLGPLEVRREGGPIELARGRARRLLIALLLRTGRVVPADVLIDQVWDVHPPADALNALQVQVSYLRRALGLAPVGAPPALRTVAGGYVLDVDPDTLDVQRFERLVASASTRVAGGTAADADTALGELQAAAELWRGEPLQDVAYEPFVAAEVERLRELRAASFEHEIDARLLLGRHDEAVPMLRQLIAEHPLREHLRAQLVLALYRSGRQAEALRAYRAARDLLVDELGVEPGRELQQLQRAVLAQDPELEWAPPPAGRGADAAGPSLRPHSEGVVASNLPWSPSPLIGRDAEATVLGGLVVDAGVRLVTLVGPPGVGKTRLAVEVARGAQSVYSDGVWFVDLGGVSDPALVPTTIAAAAQVRVDGVDSVTNTLVTQWRDARMLLVADNCEHLRHACAAVVQELLAGCPGVSILATSRVPLQVRGEQETPIGPLAVPPADDIFPLRALAEVPSVALLLARVREINPRFELTATNARAVAELCRRLDGLPLALELTARWMRLLAADELVARLDSSLDVLRDGPVDLPTRQRTVRDAVRWSYDLLAPAEQAMFRRLAVFAGGASLDTATSVCAAAGELGDDPVIVANHLVAASLVQRDDGEPPRLRMLAVVREFATELLGASADVETTELAHAMSFAAMALASEEHLKGPDQQHWLELLTAERDNLRAAMAWHRAHDVEQGQAMAAALWLYWDTTAQREEARSWLEALIAADDGAVPTSARAAALRSLGNLDSTQRRMSSARMRYEESARVAREVGDELLAARATANLGVVATTTGDWAGGRQLYEEALTSFRRLGIEWSVGSALANLGEVTLRLGDASVAVVLLEEALETFVRLGDGRLEVWCLNNLAHALHRLGDRARSRSILADGLTRSVALYKEQNLADALFAGGLIALDDADSRYAGNFLATALRARVDYLGHEMVATNLTLLAEAAATAGDWRRAAGLLGAATGFVSEHGDRLEPFFQVRFEQTAGDVRAVLGDAEFDAAWADGRSSPDGTIREACTAATDDFQALIDYLEAEEPAPHAGSTHPTESEGLEFKYKGSKPAAR
jgi:predicted ATPase/DNA-binding SARP family transcriptional activator